MSLHRVCCCGEGECCKCHPVYGGATSWTVTWNGSVSVAPGNCACIVSQFGAPSVNSPTLSTTSTITSHSYVFDWTNPLDPLTCTVKPVTGSLSYAQTGILNYDTYNVSRAGVCTFSGGPFSTGGRLRVGVAVSPPDCAVGRTNWFVEVLAFNIVRWEFTGSTSCTAPGPFTLTNTTVVMPNGACDSFLASAAVATYSAGTVTIT